MSSLWGILSDTSNLISSNLLHFTTRYLISVFPTSLFDVIDTLIRPPSPFYTVDHSNSKIPSITNTFNISFVSSATNTIFSGFHRKVPIKLSPSLKSLLSSFLPTKLAYIIIFVATASALAICTGLVFYVMILLGLEFEIEAATTTCFTALLFMKSILFAYLCVEWCVMDEIVVEEYDLERVAGMRSVAFLMITMMAIMQGILSALNSVLAGRARISDDDVVPQLVGYAALFTILSLFCFVHCKAFNGELEDLDLELEYFPS